VTTTHSSGTRHQGIRKDNPVSQPENRNALIISEFHILCQRQVSPCPGSAGYQRRTLGPFRSQLGAAILSRDRKGPAVARQLLVTRCSTTRPRRRPYIAPLAGWSYDEYATAWNALLGTGHEHRGVDAPAAPGRLADATGLPPAYIEVGQLDLHPGVPHEYDAIAFDADVSRRAQSDRDRILRSL